MKWIPKSLCLLMGAVLTADALVLAPMINFNIGLHATLLLGLFFLCWGIFYERIVSFSKTGWKKWLRYLVYAGVAFFLCVEVFLGAYGLRDNVTYAEDAVIVLGAAVQGDRVSIPLQERLEAAVSYHEQNPDAVIVVTGGQGAQEAVTEASAMERYLVGRGVPVEKIIKEEQATSTYENFLFSKELLDATFDGPYKAVLVTNYFHVYRATEIAKAVGVEANHYHAGLAWYNIPMNFVREFLAVMAMWVFGV